MSSASSSSLSSASAKLNGDTSTSGAVQPVQRGECNSQEENANVEGEASSSGLSPKSCDGGMESHSACQDAQRVCSDEERLGTSSQKFELRQAVWPRELLPATRTKMACLSCRRDNKKCDSVRPCPRCVIRNEECADVERVQPVVKKRCQGCRTKKRKCQNQRPCAPCMEEGIECIDIGRKGTGPGTRVQGACTQCRRAKYRCDYERPCKHCARRGFECVGPSLFS